MWVAMVITCTTMFADSCVIITKGDIKPNAREQCYHVAADAAKTLELMPSFQYAQPMCQRFNIGEQI